MAARGLMQIKQLMYCHSIDQMFGGGWIQLRHLYKMKATGTGVSSCCNKNNVTHCMIKGGIKNGQCNANRMKF